MAATKEEYLQKLSKISHDPEAYKEIESLIHKHFSMIDHMKATSLWDVYEYENRIAKGVLEPMQILAFDNERLKKKVNRLRKQLGMVPEYKEKPDEDTDT